MSLNNPTKKFLNENFTKTQLQKHCREIGIPNVWMNKDQLIDKIMEKHSSSTNSTTSTTTDGHVPQDEQEIGETPNPPPSLRTVLSDIHEIKEKLAIKDTEIDDLYEKLRKSDDIISRQQETINYLQEVIEHLTSLETGEQQQQNNQPHRTNPTRTLLIGDSNMSSISPKDLTAESSIRTISDANIDLLRSWVNEKLNWIPARCIIYGGITDIQENKSPSAILDDLSMLIGDLKAKNSDMIIHVCKLVPTIISDDLQAKINEFNDSLQEYCNTNLIEIINCNLPFRMATEDIDEMCFNVNTDKNSCILNRYGAIRFLECIAKSCKDFKLNEKWNEIKSQTISRNVNNDYSGPFNIRPESNKNNNVRFRDSKQNQNKYQNHYPSHSQYNHNNHNIRNHHKYNNNREYTNSVNSQSNHSYPKYINDRAQYGGRKSGGCFNCGELNHHQSKCRYDHKIRCDLCHVYGHKRRFCSYQNK